VASKIITHRITSWFNSCSEP